MTRLSQHLFSALDRADEAIENFFGRVNDSPIRIILMVFALVAFIVTMAAVLQHFFPR